MHTLKELKRLQAYFRDHPGLSGPLAEYCRSGELVARLEQDERDPNAMARLTIQLLQCMALDPLVGDQVAHFIGPAGEGDAFVLLRFNRVVNFIGGFVISKASPAYAELVAAVQANLASRMFKAAQLHRRLDQARKKAEARIVRKGRQVFDAVYQPGVAALGVRPDTVAERIRLREIADAAYDAVTVPLQERLRQRVRGVAHQAFAPAFRGNGREMMLAFVEQFLCPARTRLPA